VIELASLLDFGLVYWWVYLKWGHRSVPNWVFGSETMWDEGSDWMLVNWLRGISWVQLMACVSGQV